MVRFLDIPNFDQFLIDDLAIPTQQNTPQILTGYPIDLKLVANRPGWKLVNLHIPLPAFLVRYFALAQ